MTDKSGPSTDGAVLLNATPAKDPPGADVWVMRGTVLFLGLAVIVGQVASTWLRAIGREVDPSMMQVAGTAIGALSMALAVTMKRRGD